MDLNKTQIDGVTINNSFVNESQVKVSVSAKTNSY